MENEEYPQETTVSIAEATDFLNFLNRRKLVSHDHLGKHYDWKKWRYLPTKEIFTQGKPFQFKIEGYPYKARIIGNNVFLATLDKSNLTICHYLNGSSLNKGDEKRFDFEQVDFARDTGGEPKYEKSKYLDSRQFWPFYHEFGIPDILQESSKSYFDDTNLTKKFKIRKRENRHGGGIGVFLDREELLKYLSKQFGKGLFDTTIKNAKRKSEGIYGAYVVIDEFSKIKGRGKKLFPLAPTISDGCLCLVNPKDNDGLYLQYDIRGGLEKSLIKEEVKPKNLGNGVIVMSGDRIPKYLQRTLGLNGK